MKAVIWDMDGTLADTAELHFHGWQETLRRHGIDYSYEQFFAGFGRNNAEILRELLPEPDPATIMAISLEKETMTRTLLPRWMPPLLPGVPFLLEQFRERGIRQMIGSSGPMVNIIAIINVLEIGDYFHGILSGARIPRGKPDPAIFLHCAAAAEARPEECLVFEDSIHGVEAAIRGGMDCVVVGELARSDQLAPYLAQTGGPRCLAIGNLAAIRSVEELF